MSNETTPAGAPRTGDRLGPYRLDEVVGLGGMGVVHAATDTRLGRRVAVKIVLGQHATSPDFVARFEREASVLARLDSPHVVTIYDHGLHHEHPWLAMQLATGGDLGRMLRRRGAMPPVLAAAACAQVADALVAAHEVGVVHRDVKPANVLLRDERLDRLHVYLSDFGVALADTEADAVGGLTSPGAVAGTWNYLAPERARGAPGSPSTDVYAVGCMLWECLTGNPPYRGTDVEVAMAHLSAPVAQLPGGDETTLHLNRVLARALAKDAAERYSTARELRDDLRELGGRMTDGAGLSAAAGVPAAPSGGPSGGSSGAGVRAVAGQHHPGPRRRSRRAPVLAAAAVVLVLGGVGLAVALTAGDDAPDPTADPTGQPTDGPTSGPPTETTGPSDPTTSAEPAAPTRIAGDIDGDGLGDVAWYDYDRLFVESNAGDRFGRPESRPTDGFDTMLGDVDGDGAADVVSVGNDPPTLAAAVVLADGTRVDSVLDVPQPPGEVDADHLLADVDGDGHDDLLVATPRGGERIELGVALARADGTLRPLRTWGVADWPARDAGLTAADVDGDGDEDVVLWHSDFGDDVFFQTLRADAGTLRPVGERVSPPASVAGGSLTLDVFEFGDVDGDGTEELVGMTPYGFDALVWRWVPDRGDWSPADPWYLSDDERSTGALDATLTDVDGDGDSDVVTLGTDGVRVLLAEDRAFRYAPSWRQVLEPDDITMLKTYTLSIY